MKNENFTKNKRISLHYNSNIDPEVDAMVRHGHTSYERDKGVTCAYEKFSFCAYACDLKTRDAEENPDSESCIGSLFGFTAFSEVFIDDLFVKPDYGHDGIGRSLLTAVEEKFKDLGFFTLSLTTQRFQAPTFYEKCGFQLEHIRHHPTDARLDKFMFIKQLSPPCTRGLLKPSTP